MCRFEGEDETSGALSQSSDIPPMRATLNACCNFARAFEVGNVLSKDGAEAVFADRFTISFTIEGPGSRIDVCGEPCSYAFEHGGGGKMVKCTHQCVLTKGHFWWYHI